jgi:hypothetical protein
MMLQESGRRYVVVRIHLKVAGLAAFARLIGRLSTFFTLLFGRCSAPRLLDHLVGVVGGLRFYAGHDPDARLGTR